MNVCSDCGADYPYDLDVADMFHSWLEDKVDNVATYRDAMFASKYTGMCFIYRDTGTNDIIKATCLQSTALGSWWQWMIVSRPLCNKSADKICFVIIFYF